MLHDPLSVCQEMLHDPLNTRGARLDAYGRGPSANSDRARSARALVNTAHLKTKVGPCHGGPDARANARAPEPRGRSLEGVVCTGGGGWRRGIGFEISERPHLAEREFKILGCPASHPTLTFDIEDGWKVSTKFPYQVGKIHPTNALRIKSPSLLRRIIVRLPPLKLQY
jgi:hypothetical protein